MMKIIRYITVIFTLLIVCMSVNAITPTEVLNQVTNKISTAKGINSSFTITTNGRSMSGSLMASGNKFKTVTGNYGVWYNGKYMWSYNPDSKETTLVAPTIPEIRESNPLEYIKTYSSDYTPNFSASKVSGKYIINLLPKSKKSLMKNIEVTINSSNLKPEKFILTGRDNTKTTIVVKSIDYSKSISSTIFEYPKSKYPNARVIDLR